MKKLLAMAVPILEGKTNQFHSFLNELNNNRHAAFLESRKKLNVHERTFLQSTPMGEIVIVTLEGDDPQGAFERWSKQSDPFTQWFMEQVKDIHGLDLTQPLPAMPELVIDSENVMEPELSI